MAKGGGTRTEANGGASRRGDDNLEAWDERRENVVTGAGVALALKGNERNGTTKKGESGVSSHRKVTIVTRILGAGE